MSGRGPESWLSATSSSKGQALQQEQGDSNSIEATTRPELLKGIRAQTDVVEKPPRTTCVGIVDPLEGINQTSESQPVPDLSNHLDESELGPILEISEDLDDLVSILNLFDKPKITPQKFRPSVGDVIIAAKPKRSSLKLDNAEPGTTTTSAETKPLEFYPDNDLSHLNGLVALYQDSFYYIDDGEYRKSVSDVYEFQQGDIVVRLGSFDHCWHWSHASKFNFYLYYPKRLEGECCEGPGEIGPWFLLTNQEQSQTGGLEPDPPPKPVLTIVPSDLLPFSTISYPFEFRDGDILMHLTNNKTLFKPWNVGLDVTVEHSKTRGKLGKTLEIMDKILRYGIYVEHDVNTGRESTSIYVELYQFHGGSEWIFLGKNEGLYNHVSTLPAMIRFNVNTPQPGDILINRSATISPPIGPCFCRAWDATEQTGGLVEIYKDESFFSLLKEPREKLQNYIWGIGSDTTVVRFGTFANKEWNWMPKPSVDIFILNARGTSLIRHCRILWDDEWRPKANYNFRLHNSKNIGEVPAHFKPTTGDVIIRYLRGHLVWDDKGFEQIWEPSVKIEFFNAMHMAGNALENGNWLLRVGYERSDKKSYWTHVTAELYRYVVDPKNHTTKHWEFKGRDTYVFGALDWPLKHGLFSGREQEQPCIDPDSDAQIISCKDCNRSFPGSISCRDCSRSRAALVANTSVDHSRAVSLFLSGLGFQNMAYPLRDPWWYKITDVPIHEIDKDQIVAPARRPSDSQLILGEDSSNCLPLQRNSRAPFG